MAYRRRQGITRASTFKEEISHPPAPPDDNSSSSSSSSTSSSLAAQAIRASSAHRDSSLSSAYGESAFAATHRGDPERLKSFPARHRDAGSYEYTSMKNMNDSKYGFWGVLARKAKSILEDENVAQQFNKPDRAKPQMLDTSSSDELRHSYQSLESGRKTDNPSLQKGIDVITSSLNYIGNAFEEGLKNVEHKTADIIQETRKLQIRKKGGNFEPRIQITDVSNPQQRLQMQTDQETQLKASRDVAMAMAAKAKLLLRELKTVKADLAFAKERCAQLEEENRILRERRDKGDGPEDDDLIRLQLETLLAEKARLASENSIYARENRFLREIVEYHQLTMQDVVYLDEGIEEVTEVYPISLPAVTDMSSISPPLSPPPPPALSPPVVKDISTATPTASPAVVKDISMASISAVSPTVVKDISTTPMPTASLELVKEIPTSTTPTQSPTVVTNTPAPMLQVVSVAPPNAVPSGSSSSQISAAKPQNHTQSHRRD